METNKPKKIGLITCGKEPNYGACLQALATQEILTNNGHHVDIMNYSFMDGQVYSPFSQKSIKSFISSCMFYKLRKGTHNVFEKFRERHMIYSNEKLTTVEDFKKIMEKYDIFLVGSDQVWNPNLGINTDITLLNFYKKGPKKISYSSSFGIKSLPENQKIKYKAAFSDFNSLSTRETTGQNIIKELTGRLVPVVLDPSMLLNMQQWEIYTKDSNINEPFVLIYDMWHAPEVVEIARKKAKEKKCKIIGLSQIIMPYKDIETLYDISPAEFLDLFKKAECIVTDSFHGTVFSIIYHKEFYSYCSQRAAVIGGRLTEILDKLDLSDRMVTSMNSIPDKKIDYTVVDEKLLSLRKHSIDYLIGAINDD